MNSTPPWSSKESWHNDNEDTDRIPIVKPSRRTGILEHMPPPVGPEANTTSASSPEAEQITFPPEPLPEHNAASSAQQRPTLLAEQITDLGHLGDESPTTPFPIRPIPVTPSLHQEPAQTIPETPKLQEISPVIPEAPAQVPPQPIPAQPGPFQRPGYITRLQAVCALSLLFMLLLQVISTNATQFLGNQGWAYVLGGHMNNNDPDLIAKINKQLQKTPQAQTTATSHQRITPQQYINLLVQNMTLDQKLGQMMIVQFYGPIYSLDLSTMISQYNVGSVLIFAANKNITNSLQLKGLVQQMKNSSKPIPLAVSLDQEGGYVNRLLDIVGPRPAPATIGATHNQQKAQDAGAQAAHDLEQFGINVNLAPVVDVDNTNYSEVHQDLRTFGTTPDAVITMAGAYLQGLQQDGKVIGTLKHFPGIGSVAGDPHTGVDHLKRSLADLEKIDWAPYSRLIQQGNVHAIMVTHDIVEAVDNTKPASLSYKVIQGILRGQLGFQGVIMTDSLTMQGITDIYSPADAAALSVEAGADLLMGASTPNQVTNMADGIKNAIQSGAITGQRVDDSVRRILMMKYSMGLIPIPQK